MIPAGPRAGLWATARLVRAPFEALTEWQARYGDTFSVRAPTTTFVFTGSPKGAKTVFAADPSIFTTQKMFNLLLGEHSLFTSHGAAHKRDRKLIGQHFQSERMPVYAERIARTVDQALAELRVGQIVSVKAFFDRLVFRVLFSTVYGVSDEARAREIEHALRATVAVRGVLFLGFFPALRRGTIGPWAQFKRARARLDALLYTLIRERREEARPGDDILSQLLAARFDDGSALSDEEVRDHLVTLFLAGQGTTTITASWAADTVYRDAVVRERVRDEIEKSRSKSEPHAFSRLSYLEGILLETLRLHPTVPYVSRRLAAPLKLHGFELPAGISVAVSAWLLHQRADTFVDPRVFRPERFIGKTFGPDEYLPFGGGARRCIASAFALYELALMLGMVLRDVDLVPIEPAAPRTVRIDAAMGPSGDLPMRVARKR